MGIRKNMRQKGKKEHQGMRKHGKRCGKHNRAEKNMDSTSFSETSSDSESSSIEEMFLPALPETVKPLDLAYIPQASIDKRHGGRHLHKKDGKGGKNGKRGKKGCHGKGGKGKRGNELGGKDHHGKGHHGRKGHHGGK